MPHSRASSTSDRQMTSAGSSSCTSGVKILKVTWISMPSAWKGQRVEIKMDGRERAAILSLYTLIFS